MGHQATGSRVICRRLGLLRPHRPGVFGEQQGQQVGRWREPRVGPIDGLLLDALPPSREGSHRGKRAESTQPPVGQTDNLSAPTNELGGVVLPGDDEHGPGAPGDTE